MRCRDDESFFMCWFIDELIVSETDWQLDELANKPVKCPKSIEWTYCTVDIKLSSAFQSENNF